MPQEDPQVNSDESNGDGRQPSAKIDLQALAEEVFRLLKFELRLENERRGPSPRAGSRQG
jgi:hypothetical protein